MLKACKFCEISSLKSLVKTKKNYAFKHLTNAASSFYNTETL